MGGKKFLNSCVRIIKQPYFWLMYFVNQISKISNYTYMACDHMVKRACMLTNNTSNLFRLKNKSKKEQRRAKNIMIAIVSLLVAVILIITLRQCVFFVPVGGGAVVTRFGAYSRSVDQGLHFRIPLVERYYIVFKGFMKQETLGFIQVKAPIDHVRLTNKEKEIQKKHEKEIVEQENDKDVFPNKGNIVSNIKKGQRLTHVYLREQQGYKRPLTIDQALKILARNKEELAKINAKGVTSNGRISVPAESRQITRDLSVVELKWAVQYRINNMRNYLFNSRDVKDNLHDISLAVMSEVMGQTNYASSLTFDRTIIERQVKNRMQKIIDKLKIGIQISKVIVIHSRPIPEVQFAFDEVNIAVQDKEKFVLAAQKKYNVVIPAARGEAKRIISEAKADALVIKNNADGKASQFESILNEFLKAPEITNDRLYIEAMDHFFKVSPTTIVDPRIKGILPVFPTTNYDKIQQKVAPTRESPYNKYNANVNSVVNKVIPPKTQTVQSTATLKP